MIHLATVTPISGAVWEDLRLLRNMSALSMRDQEEITPEGQNRFRKQWNWETQSAYLFYDGDNPIGFLYLREEFGETWATYGVHLNYQRRGWGTKLVQLSQMLCRRIYIDVLLSNVTARRIYVKTGFRERYRDSTHMYMEWEQ